MYGLWDCSSRSDSSGLTLMVSTIAFLSLSFGFVCLSVQSGANRLTLVINGENVLGKVFLSWLGWITEWVTRVFVVKEGNFTRSGLDEVDESEIFEGDENTLMMTQTYTHEFQCKYKLQQYPFDTRVKSLKISSIYFCCRNAPPKWLWRVSLTKHCNLWHRRYPGRNSVAFIKSCILKLSRTSRFLLRSCARIYMIFKDNE